jgi:hypothetical protein
VGNFTDKGTGAMSAIFTLSSIHELHIPTGDTDLIKFDVSVNVSSGLFEKEFQISQFWPTAIYISRVIIYDRNYNYRRYINGTHFETPILTLTGTTPDDIPAIINWIDFNQTIADYGDTVKVQASLSDDISGIDHAYLYLVSMNNPLEYGRFEALPTHTDGLRFMEYNNVSELYEWDFEVKDGWTGPIIVMEVWIWDNAGNEISYTPRDYTINLLEINGYVDTVAPSVWMNNTWGWTSTMYIEVQSSEFGQAEVYLDDTLIAQQSFTDSLYDTFSIDTTQFKDDYYTVSIIATDEHGNSATTTFSIELYQPDNYIWFILPELGESETGQKVDFLIKCNSSFWYDQELTFELFANGPGGDVSVYEEIITIPKRQVSEFTVSVTFNISGHYYMKAWLYDVERLYDTYDVWRTFEWSVVGEDINTSSETSTPKVDAPGFKGIIPLIVILTSVRLYKKRRPKY